MAPLRDPSGDVSGVVAVVQDVTQEHQLVRELAASEERFRTLYQVMACAIVVRNAQGEIVDANAAAEEILGLSLAEMRARGTVPIWPMLHEDGTPLSDAERPHRIALRTGQAVRGFTFGAVRGDGEYRWLRTDCVPVLGHDGKPLYVVSSAIDVTERVRAEEAVRRSEERARSLIENLTDVIMIVDPAGTLRYVSPSVERCLGYAPDSLVGHTLWAYLHADDAEPVRATLAEAEATPGVGLPTGCRARHRDGTWRALELVCQNHLHDPSVGGIVVNARDVTERQEAERRLQELAQADKLRALGQMASGVAHDLNQYLGLVAGHGDLALCALDGAAPDVESARDSLGVVVQAAMDGGETVKRLLMFARPPQDGTALPLDLGELLREVAKLTAPQWRDAAQAQGRPISLHVEVEGSHHRRRLAPELAGSVHQPGAQRRGRAAPRRHHPAGGASAGRARRGRGRGHRGRHERRGARPSIRAVL